VLSSVLLNSKREADLIQEGQETKTPLTSFGESPFDEENLFRDSNFNDGITWWNYTSSDNVTSEWDSSGYYANISHYSDVSTQYYTKFIQISSAIYDDSTNYTSEFLNDDATTGAVYHQKYLDLIFTDNLDNGDNISLNIEGGDDGTITIYDYQAQTPVGGYAEEYYDGPGSADINFTLNGLSSPTNAFSILVTLQGPPKLINIDLVAAHINTTKPKTFTERASVNQTVTIENFYNLTYFVNFTAEIPTFDGIDDSMLFIKINDSKFWDYQLSSTSSPMKFSVETPDYVKEGGDFLISFEIELSINSIYISNFTFLLDDAYFLKKPDTNLLNHSNLNLKNNWNNSTSGADYRSYLNPTKKYFEFYSYQTGTPLFDGWTALNQSFYKINTGPQHQLALKYLVSNLSGVEKLNLEIFLNTTLLTNKSITKASNSWNDIRINITEYIFTDQYYEVSLKFNVNADETEDLLNWTAFLDDIYIYPLWGSNITVTKDLNPDLTVGEETDIIVYYNTTITGDPIIDSKIRVYNNNTQKEWGLDFSSTKKYQVNNENNGTYKIDIYSIGATFGMYNLSFLFIRPNFADFYLYKQINITGAKANFTIEEGGYFNETHNTWFNYDNNSPYVNDDTRFIKVKVWDNVSLNLLENAFIEASLRENVLSWVDLYRTSGNPVDKGFYEIYFDTTNIGVVTNYLELNMTVKMSITGYNPFNFNVSTLVKHLPTNLSITEIDPFYEGSKITVSAVFEDTFHSSGIENANISWKILERPELHGNLDYIISGFYQKELDLSSLTGGYYTLQISAEKENYNTSILNENIQVLSKSNVKIAIIYSPGTVYEGNSFSVMYNFSIFETGDPVIDSRIDFKVVHSTILKEEIFSLYTDDEGQITLELYADYGETEIVINTTFSGTTEIADTFNLTIVHVIPKRGINITLVSNPSQETLIGGSNITLIIKATYNNTDTPVGNIHLIVRIGTSEVTTITNESGIAIAIIELPLQGQFLINITFLGSNSIYGSSITPISIDVISPTTITIINLTSFAIILLIIAMCAIAAYVVVKKKVINPRTREIQENYLELMNRIDDVKSMTFLTIYKEHGISLYSKTLSEIPIDPQLISGFLGAITIFGKSMVQKTEQKENGFLKDLTFEKYKLILDSGEDYNVALVLTEAPSEQIKENLAKFTTEAQTIFNGYRPNIDMLDYKSLEILLDKRFHINLARPYEIDFNAASLFKLNKWERNIIAQIQMETFKGEIYLDKVIKRVGQYYIGKEDKIKRAFLRLLHLEIITPIKIERKP